MKEVSHVELAILQDHLKKKPFKYDEVFSEVLDHYATAFEQSGDDLSTVIRRMDEDFTDSKIEKINSKYFNDLRKSLQKNHWTIFFGNFRWPQLINTLGLAILLFLLAPFAMEHIWLGRSLYIIFGVTPILIGIYYYFKLASRKWMGKTFFKSAHGELFGIAFGFSVLYMQLPTFCKVFISEDFKLLGYDPLLTSVILLVGLIQGLTTIKLINLKIKPALA